jgi:hypothetical protein
MPQTTRSLLRFPLGPKTSKTLRGRIDRIASSQAAAATLTDIQVIDLAGDTQALNVVVNAIPAAGETLVVDIQKNGVTILAAPVTLDNTMTTKVKVLNPVAGTVFAIGDRVSFIRTYTAGGGPAPIGPNKIILEIA